MPTSAMPTAVMPPAAMLTPVTLFSKKKQMPAEQRCGTFDVSGGRRSVRELEALGWAGSQLGERIQEAVSPSFINQR